MDSHCAICYKALSLSAPTSGRGPFFIRVRVTRATGAWSSLPLTGAEEWLASCSLQCNASAWLCQMGCRENHHLHKKRGNTDIFVIFTDSLQVSTPAERLQALLHIIRRPFYIRICILSVHPRLRYKHFGL